MYKVYSDSYLIYSDTIESLKIKNAKLELEVNKTGAFEFEIYPNHAYYNKIKKLKSIITVYQDDFLIFRGRVLDEEMGFHNQKQVVCEGELAFLLDSIQRPYDFSGSITEFLTQLITTHNAQVESSKQFTLGNVTVTDPNNTIARSDIEYSNTWDVINKKLIELLGGYITVRHQNGLNYIDYLADFTSLSTQTVEFAKNLLNLKHFRQGGEISTALIPLGAKIKNSEGQDTDERLTIRSVNDDIDYIYNQAVVQQYGWLFTTQIWDDVTEASNLLTKGQAYLASIVNEYDSIELDAADLATIDRTVSSFHLGTYVRVKSNPHGIDQNFLVSKLSINLLNPASNKLTLGGVVQSFTEQATNNEIVQKDMLNVVSQNVADTNTRIYQTEQNLQSSIEASAENIILSVEEKHYLKDETDSLISSVRSSLEQTSSGFEMQFEKFNADIDDLIQGTDAEFELIKKYIRFTDGSIWLGEVGNELELKISNDRISFLQNNAEVAYLSNNKLYVTDGEYTNSLRLGNFAFVPRANGNLSFKKIT